MNKFFLILHNLFSFLLNGFKKIIIHLAKNEQTPNKTYTSYKSNVASNSSYSNFRSKPKESHLDMVRDNEFSPQKLLNEIEASMYYGLIHNIDTKKYAVFPQASCGEIFYSKKGHKAINCKRVDFCIVNKTDSFKPSSIIEVHGSGHFLRGSENTVIRDATIKEACMKSGVKYHEYRTDLNKSINKWIAEELQYLAETDPH